MKDLGKLIVQKLAEIISKAWEALKEFVNSLFYPETPIYCENCGAEIITEKIPIRFDPYTGTPTIYRVTRRCSENNTGGGCYSKWYLTTD